MSANYSIRKYLDNNMNVHGGPVYNDFRWERSVVNGANSEVTIPVVKGEQARFIWVQKIILQGPIAGTGAIFDFIDTRFPTKIIFSVYDVIPLLYSPPFDYLAFGNRLTISINDNTTIFSLGYCTVSQLNRKETR